MRLCLLGDIAFIGSCSIKGNTNWKDYFKDVADYLMTADYVVGNLETPFSHRKKPFGAKSAYLCSDIADADILKYINIDAVNVANNHMFDYGTEGYETTKRVLTEKGIKFFGGEGKSLIVDCDGSKLAFSGFCCYSTNPLFLVQYGCYGINELNYQKVQEVMEDFHNDGYLNIVSVHAGIEHVNYPDKTSIKSARKLAATMDYVFYGHHPHVSQGLEKVNGSVLAYSLGNFCFDDIYSSVSSNPLVELTDNNRSSFILSLDIIGNKIMSHEIIPIYIGKDKIHVGTGTDKTQLEHYTKALPHSDFDSYMKMRQRLVNGYYNKRKSARDIHWLLRRCRWRYIKLSFDMFLNKIKYLKTIHEL